jgi:hypothetical protein
MQSMIDRDAAGANADAPPATTAMLPLAWLAAG